MAVGELLTQLARSFAQGRDFNLQAANVRASAAVRIQQFQLEKERRELEEERTRQAISASQTEQKIKEFTLTEEVKAGRRVRELEKMITSSQLIGPRQVSEPAPADERVAGAFEELGRPVPASLEARVEEGALTEPQRRARKVGLERTEALTEESRARTRQIREGKDPDQIAQARLFRDIRRDYNQYVQGLSIINVLKEEGEKPTPVLTFEKYALSILGGQFPSQNITVPGLLLGGNVAPEDSLIFTPQGQ